ncbi:MAG: hypothetical protein Q4D98_02980 [Planctomycetia bacterium]|nr:hypothetical protein [Planctomycetia bacterium]
MAKGNRSPRTEKQMAASRCSKGGGRPRTGQTPQKLISFPADWVERISSLIPPGQPKNRWIMEQVEKSME